MARCGPPAGHQRTPAAALSSAADPSTTGTPLWASRWMKRWGGRSMHPPPGRTCSTPSGPLQARGMPVPASCAALSRYILCLCRAYSSAVEQLPHKESVAGSIPAGPTPFACCSYRTLPSADSYGCGRPLDPRSLVAAGGESLLPRHRRIWSVTGHRRALLRFPGRSRCRWPHRQRCIDRLVATARVAQWQSRGLISPWSAVQICPSARTPAR